MRWEGWVDDSGIVASDTIVQGDQMCILTQHSTGCQGDGMQAPNGLPISRRERATRSLQKANDLAREAVGCIGVFGAPVAVARVATRMRRPHRHGTTPAQRAFGRNHAHLGSRPAQRALIWNHAQHTITLPTTGNPHNGRSYHAGTTSFQHNGPSYHTCTTGFGTTETGTTRLQEARFATSKPKKE